MQKFVAIPQFGDFRSKILQGTIYFWCGFFSFTNPDVISSQKATEVNLMTIFRGMRPQSQCKKKYPLIV